MTHSTLRSVRNIIATLKRKTRRRSYTERDIRFAIQVCAGANIRTVSNYFRLLKELRIIRTRPNGEYSIDDDSLAAYVQASG